jgi:hypothetical protein
VQLQRSNVVEGSLFVGALVSNAAVQLLLRLTCEMPAVTPCILTSVCLCRTCSAGILLLPRVSFHCRIRVDSCVLQSW